MWQRGCHYGYAQAQEDNVYVALTMTAQTLIAAKFERKKAAPSGAALYALKLGQLS